LIARLQFADRGGFFAFEVGAEFHKGHLSGRQAKQTLDVGDRPSEAVTDPDGAQRPVFVASPAARRLFCAAHVSAHQTGADVGTALFMQWHEIGRQTRGQCVLAGFAAVLEGFGAVLASMCHVTLS